MTVVLLDPRRPDAVPVAAARLVAGPVEVADDVPEPVRAQLQEHPGAEVLVATAPRYPGDAVLDAVALMDALRVQGHWESAQTHISLRRYLLEEAYELLDAVHGDDRAELREELGDVLLQVLFHARIAADHPDDPFSLDEVAETLTRKLRNRTPLDYGSPGAPLDAEEQNRRWHERKAAEKRRRSALDGIAMAQPSLALAEQVLARASAAGVPADLVPAELISVAVAAGGEAEQELRAAVRDFAQRFRAVEAQLHADASSGISAEAWRSAWAAAAH
jgi:XTP/dITP diphosphohydrolase